ncbi:MAG: thioesterase family protein [Candidatus Omnitrophica bacterium]|nr:thioesterase family protein [Candidatus Omnitrophota bacterium]
MKIKIYYHDTDGYGVVYYANYLKYLEEARTELLAEKGCPVKELFEQGVFFVVARQEIDYRASAVYGDTLDIQTKISKISAVKIIFEYQIYNQHKKLLTEAKTVLVCVDKNLKPKAIPEEIRKKIS